MSKLLSRKGARDLLLGLVLLTATLALMLWPQQSMEAAKTGLLLCYNVIIPSLFPFFVLSTLVVELGLAGYVGRVLEGIMRPLFNVPGACASAVALGFIGGYPVGARTAISLYEKGMCTKTEAERLLAFCNNSGPAFILGVVGAGIFASSKVGVLLYLAHAAASLCIGLLFRFYKRGEGGKEKGARLNFEAQRLSVAFTGSIKNSFLSTLNICAFVVFFTVVIRMLIISGALPALAGGLSALLSPGPDGAVGGAAADRRAGDLLGGLDPVGGGLPARAAVHGGLHAGLGGYLGPQSGALLFRGQRPVGAHLPDRQDAPRRPVRSVRGGPGPAVPAGGRGIGLPGRAGGGHRLPGLFHRPDGLHGGGLGGLAGLFRRSCPFAEKNQWKSAQTCSIIRLYDMG